MLMRMRRPRDPWWDDGQGVRRQRARHQRTGAAALAVAIVACGLTAAVWIQYLVPGAVAALH